MLSAFQPEPHQGDHVERFQKDQKVPDALLNRRLIIIITIIILIMNYSYCYYYHSYYYHSYSSYYYRPEPHEGEHVVGKRNDEGEHGVHNCR